MPNAFDPSCVRFNEATGLVPAIVQDVVDGTVLMLGYMNEESLSLTQQSGNVTFYSRSRERMWEKGETSGNTLTLVSISADCDSDALLVRVRPVGPTCHTGERSCFGKTQGAKALGHVLAELRDVISERDRTKRSGSYTVELLESGVLRCAQKVAEEAVEVALSAAAEPDRLPAESADLLYHLLVLWQQVGVTSDEVASVLELRQTTL